MLFILFCSKAVWFILFVCALQLLVGLYCCAITFSPCIAAVLLLCDDVVFDGCNVNCSNYVGFILVSCGFTGIERVSCSGRCLRALSVPPVGVGCAWQRCVRDILLGWCWAITEFRSVSIHLHRCRLQYGLGTALGRIHSPQFFVGSGSSAVSVVPAHSLMSHGSSPDCTLSRL